MRGLMRTVLIAVAMLLSCDPARADRELFTFDCQGQVHIMAGTPVALSFRCSLFALLVQHQWSLIRWVLPRQKT